MDKLVFLVMAVVVTVLMIWTTALLTAYVMFDFYNWFVVPIDVPGYDISFLHFFGLFLLLVVIRNALFVTIPKEIPEFNWQYHAVKTVVLLCVWLSGWLIFNHLM